MNNLNFQANDIAVVNMLAGSKLSANILKKYNVEEALSSLNCSSVEFPLIADEHQPIPVGPGIYLNRVYTKENQRMNVDQRHSLVSSLARAAFDFFIVSGWNGSFRMVSFRDAGGLSLVNIGLVHEHTLDSFISSHPRAIVGERTVNCGQTLEQMTAVISSTLWEIPLYNDLNSIRKAVSTLA